MNPLSNAHMVLSSSLNSFKSSCRSSSDSSRSLLLGSGRLTPITSASLIVPISGISIGKSNPFLAEKS